MINAAADVAHSVEAADVDGDSDLDIVGASVGDDTLAWYQNDGNENFVKHVVTNAIDGMLTAVAADIDGDGDQDVLSCSGNGDTVAWHENDGGGNFVTHLISTTVDAANSVSAVDLDGDCVMDFLTTSGGLAANRKILWYESDGAQNFAEHVISNDRLSATMATASDIVNDTTTDKVFKYTVAGSLVGSWAIDAANSKPTGITLDPASASDLWIVDSGTDRVYEYTAAAGRTSGSQAASASFALAAGNANSQGIVVSSMTTSDSQIEPTPTGTAASRTLH